MIDNGSGKTMVELFAGFPSVVIGFFGMVIVAPFLQNPFDLATGLNIFNAGVMLAFMSIPTICSISEDAMRAEFERLLPAMRSGGFIPSVDHQTPPGVSMTRYKQYLQLLRTYTEV